MIVPAIKIRAELARRALSSSQLVPYDDADKGYIDPRRDPETIQSAFDFILWLERECVKT